MAEKLVIDLHKVREQETSKIRCSYKHHPQNRGFDALLEKISFALICRKCEAAPCVRACPREALEKVPIEGSDESVLKRANMRCTGCGTCAIACPFGTIYTELIPFVSSVCDVCRGRLAPGEKPLCVQTSDGSIEYKEVTVEGDFVEVFDDIVVNVPSGTLWQPLLGEIGTS